MNEFALGGGVSECGDSVATTAKDTGLYPWLGITTPYAGVDTDPWCVTGSLGRAGSRCLLLGALWLGAPSCLHVHPHVQLWRRLWRQGQLPLSQLLASNCMQL